MSKNDAPRPVNPALKRALEFDTTLESIQSAFCEMWPLVEHLGIESFAAIQYPLGLQEADIIAVYLCGLVRGISHQSDHHHSSPLAAWEVAKQFVRYAVEV